MFIRKTADQINSLQELYDTMCAWLLREDAVRCGSGTACYYLKKNDGNRCVVGALLPEGDPLEDAGSSVGMLREKWVDSSLHQMASRIAKGGTGSISIIEDDVWNVMRFMQSIHDPALNWSFKGLNDAAKKELVRLAEDYKLTPISI